MVQGLEEINHKISTQFKPFENKENRTINNEK